MGRRPAGLIRALKRSGRGIARLLTLGLERGGLIPATRAYVWRNLPLDVGPVLAYFVVHEAHHRRQIVMLARQLGHRLPRDVTDGLWQWTARSTKAKRLGGVAAGRVAAGRSRRRDRGSGGVSFGG